MPLPPNIGEVVTYSEGELKRTLTMPGQSGYPIRPSDSHFEYLHSYLSHQAIDAKTIVVERDYVDRVRDTAA